MKKKIYSFLAVLTTLSFGAAAQNIDLQAINTVDPGAGLCPGYTFSPSTTPGADSVQGIFGVDLSQGPEAALEGDKVTFRSSFNHFLTQAECDAQSPPVAFEDKYAWYSIYTLTAANITNGFFAFSFEEVDSIGMLIDWDRWEQYGQDSMRVYGPPHENFVTGQHYGLFTRTWGMGESANDIQNTDADMQNNISVVEIVWNDCATSISDMIVGKKRAGLNVYPNPSNDKISFDFNFTKNTNVDLIVRDFTGRVVLTQNVGHVSQGDRKFTMNVASLTTGTYTVEMSSGTESAIAKFTKN